jgi:phage baseplate assembly protein W
LSETTIPNYDELTEDQVLDEDGELVEDEDEYEEESESDDEDETSRTYAITADGTVAGFVDELDAIRQAVYLILNTERYDYQIYSWDYGSEIKGLYGMPMDYCIAELERLIPEALKRDDRIDDVTDFEFAADGSSLTVAFTVHTLIGEMQMETEFNV